ncbi:hypothetical protein Taro_023404 [Colocasia esculenta]|uniref:Phosphatidic acid phosphatase type 2/haloperoxidase domain-containing protein n=1 Tax=Colocasia esculenta TaxID=4460 RepID=A0A843UXB6_COLES|nr:hypothetical protein [Colocasia esculenta]
MADIQLGVHTIKSHGIKVARFHMHDWFILLLLVAIEVGLNVINPFYRFVGKDMMTDLSYPLKSNTVPFWAVPLVAIILPFAIFIAIYFMRRDVYDLHHAILGLLYAVLITGVITDAIKDAVGRPRPDFFWRCFPDGKSVGPQLLKLSIFPHNVDNLHSGQAGQLGVWMLSGDTAYWSLVEIAGGTRVSAGGPKEGVEGGGILLDDFLNWRHLFTTYLSILFAGSFAGLGFLSWYLSGKIKAFDRRGHIAKLCIVFLPLLVAALVGISRVDDYWHHWQDVFAGGLIGITVASFCYLQFFPLPYDANGMLYLLLYQKPS